jgi:hypothetical protein
MKMNGQLYVPDALLLRKEPPLPIEFEAEWTRNLVCMYVDSSLNVMAHGDAQEGK